MSAEIPSLSNGKNPLIERVQRAVSILKDTRAKVNFGYISLGATLGTAAFLSVWGAVTRQSELWQAGLKLIERVGVPVVMAIIVSNVATKAANGGSRGTSGTDPAA